MADGQAFFHRVFAAQNVHIRTADRGRGDANQGICRADLGNGLVIQHNSIFVDKDRSFHVCHGNASAPGVDGKREGSCEV
ncbi:hypothetical protein D3C76_1552680 [compost metagenome]